jgi:hypothetical protein
MTHPGGEDALQPPVAWDINIDTMLAQWCDSAKCFEWMHSETHSVYEGRSKAFMIATNCVTAVAGLSNVISGGTRYRRIRTPLTLRECFYFYIDDEYPTGKTRLLANECLNI